MVDGNSRVVFPKICTILGSLNAFTVKSAVTVESFPPEKEITILVMGYFSASRLINSCASATRKLLIIL